MDFPLSAPNPNDTAKPLFYVKAVQNMFETEKQGRAIYLDVEWVDILIPGDTKTKVSRKVTEEDKHRWPHFYQAFISKREAPVVGTPIDQWPILSPAKVDELKSLNIKSIEDMAKLPDQYLEVLGMGGRELKIKAAAYLESAAGTADVQALRAELDRAKQENTNLKDQIKDLATRLQSLEDDVDAPRKRSRKDAA